MFLRVLYISLVVALLFQQCQSMVTYILFKMERSYLAKNICENRNDFKSNCKAHCQLLKVIRHHEKQQQNKMPMKGEAETEFTMQFHRPNVPLNILIASNLLMKMLLDEYLLAWHSNIPVQPPENKSSTIISISFRMGNNVFSELASTL